MPQHSSTIHRDIPYNYTSFSDREIVCRFLGADTWKVLESLQLQRKTGQSQRMLFEILGDLWIITRNPIIQEELLDNPKHLEAFMADAYRRVCAIEDRSQQIPTVSGLLHRIRDALDRMYKEIHGFKQLREDLRHLMAKNSPATHLDFSIIARVSSVTDATDWRVEYPFVVITAQAERDLPPIISICNQLDLILIARGGGTGYTGAGVPLFPRTAILNMERLNGIDPVRRIQLPGSTVTAATIRVEAGAVTNHVALAAQREGLVFAVDPTSRNASTIGGNIAMNAGGKKAVLWGTTLDNLVSWTMVTPDGDWMQVERLAHNQGKIHDLPHAQFRILRWQPGEPIHRAREEVLTIPAHAFRKPGLGKDVTNKALGGLPGVQKEGCDGLITSAVFILYPNFKHIRTVCLEFFSPDLGKAVPAIVEIKHYLDRHSQVGCAGLEHMDARYIRAVDYNTKAARNERPRMVLLADIVGDQAEDCDLAAQEVVRLAKAREGEGFIAVSTEERQRFWADRSRTAAIAKHTNAFKVNEDIVIPLEKLAEYNQGVERINIEQSLKNKIFILESFVEELSEERFAQNFPGNQLPGLEGSRIVADKLQAARMLLDDVRLRWSTLLTHLDTPVCEPAFAGMVALGNILVSEKPLIDLLLRGEIIISFRREVRAPLRELFSGEHWSQLQINLDTLHRHGRSRRIFIALHMHAGDGNVHTNIPVNSNDYEMLREAERIVNHIMKLAQTLGGRISGEHGIGMTKFAHLDRDIIDAFVAYKERVDPHHRFNRGKLLPDGTFFSGPIMDRAYTPSLRLVQQEAIILEESAMGGLNDAIRNCLRCGKCKEVCTTHVPESGLFYSPRNKILALGLAIEAFLYEEQTRRGLSTRNMGPFADLADHCAVCHRCSVPCPVHIDFGQVTMAMRGIQVTGEHPWSRLNQKVALTFLTTKKGRWIRYFRRFLLVPAYDAQRYAHVFFRKNVVVAWLMNHMPHVPRLRRLIAIPQSLLQTPLPQLGHDGTSRTLLGWDDQQGIPWIPVASTTAAPMETVFYFPGCGCERLFSDVALATLAMVHHLGIQTVLPSEYMCCGFPQKAAGDAEKSRKISMENRVLLHRMANTLDFLSIKTVLVSCGTCLSQMQTYHFETIFPGCRVMDIHEFLYERGVRVHPETDAHILFHDPCHTPMRHHAPLRVVSTLTGSKVTLTERCCSEAGTFALAHPEAANQARLGKIRVFQQAMCPPISLAQDSFRIMTSCPSCYQGLHRIGGPMKIPTDFLVVFLARKILGDDWRNRFLAQVASKKTEPILFN
ncbi:MAG: DUF3683 domain-containing protein [Magnetococcales bacterium]|nr:DUF3683 domain-containing protein [Magnetococcales bacterium]